MKKITICILATCFVLSVIPTQLKAGTDVDPAKATMKSAESTVNNDRLNEIQSIKVPVLNSSDNKEVLKETSPVPNDQDGRNRRYLNRHDNRNVGVSIRADHQVRDDGYYEGRHNHRGAYIGGGGVLILIIILILVL